MLMQPQELQQIMECSTVDSMNDRLERGMYILLRQGSACHNLRTLIQGVTPENSRRCLLCSDDRQPKDDPS